MKIYIYVIYFPISKRPNPYYVGLANNLERRMFEHLNSNSLVGNALNKYDDWIVKKLHTCKTYDGAFRIEIEEIRNFNCIAPNGYNMTHGGEGWSEGMKHTKETIEKMIKNHKGFEGLHHTKESITKGIKTKHKNGTENHSEEWKQNQSKKMQGNKYGLGKRSEEFCRLYKGKGNPMFGKKRFDTIKRNKENNSMSNPVNVLKMKITTLKNKIAKLKSE